MEVVLPGGLEGGDGPAVEGVSQGDDSGPALAVLLKGPLAGGLDHALVGLGPGVAEERRLHPRRGHQLACKLRVGLGVEEVGDVAHLHGLLVDGVGPGLVGAAQGADADAGGEVDVLFSLGAPEDRALAVVDGQGVAAVGLHNILLV